MTTRCMKTHLYWLHTANRQHCEHNILQEGTVMLVMNIGNNVMTTRCKKAQLYWYLLQVGHIAMTTSYKKA